MPLTYTKKAFPKKLGKRFFVFLDSVNAVILPK